MRFTKSLRNLAFCLSLAGCASVRSGLEELTEKADFSPISFANSPWVSVTGYHEPKNAKTTFIHLRQMHFNGKDMGAEKPESANLSKVLRGYRDINNIQRDIYFFLSDLRKIGVNEIWAEGVTDFFFDQYNPAEEYSSIFLHLSKSRLFNETDSYKFIPGADLLLAICTDYKIIPAEDFYLHERAVLSIETRSCVYKNVLKDREDYLVAKVANSGKPYVFSIYGGEHSFLDNVILWNIKNPGKEISFIELTPKSFPENRD